MSLILIVFFRNKTGLFPKKEKGSLEKGEGRHDFSEAPCCSALARMIMTWIVQLICLIL